MKRLILLIVPAVLTLWAGSCSSPGTLIVQIRPEKEPITYIRAYETDKPFIQRDMVAKGNGKFEARYPPDSEISVIVKAEGRKPIHKTARMGDSDYQYLEFDISRRAADVEFIRMKSNREIKFKPINKTRNGKTIYLSYIDYIGQNLLLKKRIEYHLRLLGYKDVETVNNNTELIVTINLVDFVSDVEIEAFNKYTINQYKFKIIVEQRLKGNTKLEEKRAYFRGSEDSINYSDESYPMIGSKKAPVTIVRDFTVNTPDPVEPSSPGVLVMMGLVEDEAEEGEKKEADAEKEEGEKKEADASSDEKSEKMEDPAKDEKETAEKGEEEKAETDVSSATETAGTAAYLNTRGAHSKATLDFHSYQEEAIIEASVRLINLHPQDERASAKIIELLSRRLAHLFNL